MTPTAPHSSAWRCAASEPAFATRRTRASDRRDRSAANEIARGGERGVGREQDVGIGGVSRRQQRDPGQVGERRPQFLIEHRVAPEQREADDHGPSPRRSSRRSRPPAPVARPSATATGARTVTMMPPERSLAGESSSSPRAAT